MAQMQPCPDCGTIMDECGEDGEDEYIFRFYCRNCGMMWTTEEIEYEHFLNALIEEEGDYDGSL